MRYNAPAPRLGTMLPASTVRIDAVILFFLNDI